jgi:hypothetical protein
MMVAMIADLDTAKRVSELLLQITEQLNESTRMVQIACPEAEFSRYRRAVAAIMAEILEVINPLYATHPSLAPPGFE